MHLASGLRHQTPNPAWAGTTENTICGHYGLVLAVDPSCEMKEHGDTANQIHASPSCTFSLSIWEKKTCTNQAYLHCVSLSQRLFVIISSVNLSEFTLCVPP